MATTNKKEEQIFIGNDDMVVELTGEAKAEFIAERDARAQEALLLEAEYKAKQDARESAIKKLAEIAGLTKEELASIL
jgi:predicted Holliday junction resolvase-like endonuclease